VRVRALVTVLLLATAGWPPAAALPAEAADSGVATTPTPQLTAAYPNPVFDGDDGEFVVLDVPAGVNLSAYELSDGEDTIELPATDRAGELALAANASAAELAGYDVLPVQTMLSLSNAGETIHLRRTNDSTVVDTLQYEDASEAVLQTPSGPKPVGQTTHRPATTGPANVTAFVLPDDSRPTVDALETADDRILLAGYTLTSTRIRELLLDATARGVAVRVLLDGAPVGGDSPAQVRALDELSAAGVDVRLIGGARARYAFHHAKYAVADDDAIVVTENWKASGTGGHGNRGWGMVVHDERFADALATVYRSDADWRGIQHWPAVREPASRDAGMPANDSYPRRFPARRFQVESATLAVTPDNAERVVLGFIGNATDSLRVQQVRLGDGTLQRALVDAAERGVSVELLLSGKWYVRDENQLLATCLNGYADRAGVPLTVRVVEPRSRFGKVHAKVAVADGDRVLLGSLNWNQYALDRNREVIVVADGDRVAEYYGRVFTADWRGGAWRIPWSVLVTVAGAVLGAGWVLRRWIQFEPDEETAAAARERGRVWVDDADAAGSAVRDGGRGAEHAFRVDREES